MDTMSVAMRVSTPFWTYHRPGRLVIGPGVDVASDEAPVWLGQFQGQSVIVHVGVNSKALQALVEVHQIDEDHGALGCAGRDHGHGTLLVRRRRREPGVGNLPTPGRNRPGVGTQHRGGITSIYGLSSLPLN